MFSVEESVNVLFAQVDLLLVIFLMAVGYIIKHKQVFNKIDNSFIPVILPAISVIISLAMGNLSTRVAISNDIISGVINGTIAVWAHQTGRNIFDVLSKIKTSDNDTETEDKDFDEIK